MYIQYLVLAYDSINWYELFVDDTMLFRCDFEKVLISYIS